MRRDILTWSIVAAIVIAAFAGTVLILNASLYSAGGFVRGYLDALERHDAAGALELAGDTGTAGASDELLTVDGMGELSDIRLVSDTEGADGVHRVVYSYLAGGVAGQSAFSVERKGTLLGFFPTWDFVSSPLGVIRLSVLHDSEFTANGVDLVTPQQGAPASYLVFAPGSYEIEHDSKYLHADPITVAVTEPSKAVIAELDVQANAAFAEKVTEEVTAHLDGCTTQTVLLPTGCPFGQEISNRIVTTPKWSMSVYPEVTIVPGPDANSWLMPPTDAAAHLTVDVKSLFDGTISTVDEDVPFRASYLITFLPTGELLLTSRF